MYDNGELCIQPRFPSQPVESLLPQDTVGSFEHFLIDLLYDVAHRLSTYPLVHLNFFHALLNVIALTPLVERFENEYGTLTTFALFFGRKDD